MNNLVLLALWVVALTGWFNVLYLYSCGQSGKSPNYRLVINSLVAAVIGMAVGTTCNSIIQASLRHYWRF